jgi:DNA-binding transcriptional ArsR family regulator
LAAKSAQAGGRRKAGEAVEAETQQAKAHPPPPPPPSREEEQAQMAKALGHPTRLKILTVAHQRAISPSEFAREHDMVTGTVSHHFKKLVEWGAIKLVKKEPVSGSTRHMYVGTKRAIYTEKAWPEFPESVQSGLATATLQELFRVMSLSIDSGVFTARDDFTFTWEEVPLDEIAWKKLWSILRLVWQKVPALVEESEARAEQTGEKLLKAVVGLIAFEAAEPERPKPVRRKRKAKAKAKAKAKK